MTRKLTIVACLLFVAMLIAACAQAPATVDTAQPNANRAGQGDNIALAAAGDAQAGNGAQPNRHGNAPADGGDGSEVTGTLTDGEKSVQFTVKGSVRTLYIGLENNAENNADVTISGTTSDTSQANTPTITPTATPTADNDVDAEGTLDITP